MNRIRFLRWLTLERLVVIIVFVSIFTMAVRVPTDSDTWWHLRSGQWIVENRAIPRIDPFSHTRYGQPWVDHSWLAQIVLYLVFHAFGYAGLGILVAALAAIALYFVWLVCLGTGNGPIKSGIRFWLCAFTLIVAAATSAVIWAARPQMFSFAFTAVTAFLLHRFKQGNTKALWGLPPLMLVWVNTHGGFAVCFILMAAFAFGELGNWVLRIVKPGDENNNPFPKRLGQLGLVALVCLLIVPINPNGIQMWQYPFRTVGIGVLQDFIAEWRPPDFHQMHLHPFIWMVLGCFTVLGLAGKTADWTDLTLVALFTYMSLLAGRNIALFALVSAPVIVEYGNTALAAWLERMQWAPKLRPKIVGNLTVIINWSLLALICLAAAIKIIQPLGAAINEQTLSRSMPVNAIEFLKQNRPAGPLFNSYNWGGFIVWNLPEYPVYVDGRTDLYDDAFLRDYIAIIYCQPGWEEKLDEQGINLVLIEPQSFIGQMLLNRPGWEMLYQDPLAILFARKDVSK